MATVKTIAEDIYEAFAPVTNTANLEALIAKVEAALEVMPEADVAVLLTKLGFEITEKKRAATAIAIAKQIMATVGPMLMAL